MTYKITKYTHLCDNTPPRKFFSTSLYSLNTKQKQ